MERRWTWEFDVPRERLWPHVADTDWVNRHAGLPAIEARYEPLPDGTTRRIARFAGIPLKVEWEECPTVWRVPEFFTVERRYRSGPISHFVSRTSLETVAAGTRVVMDVQLEPAAPIAAPLLPLIFANGRRGADRAFRLAARLAVGGNAAPAETHTDLGQLEPLLGTAVDPAVAAELARYVATAEDRDVARMRPYELADRWHVSRRETLRAFLHATQLGLLDMHWTVLCPSCRGASPGFDSLEDLRHDYHCPACNISYGATFDRSVEVTFDAAPLGRSADAGLYCIASPQRSAHVYAQCAVPARGDANVALSLPQGNYEFELVGGGAQPFSASDEEEGATLTAALLPHGVDVGATVRSGDLTLNVRSELDREAIVRIQDGRWPDTIATAAEVTAFEEFRRLFSSQVLAPGFEMSIRTLAVLFTDLVGSTAMYSRTGDAPAFRVVTDHFDVLRAIVAERDGTIVKTIGDAVMAVFVDPVRCLDAALQFDGAVRGLQVDGAPLRLRAGMHAGPCIAMRANDRIDYFGTTINLAARMQALAGPGEVTLARKVAEWPEVAKRLAAEPVTIAAEVLQIKGFAEAIDVVRIAARPSTAALRASAQDDGG